MYYRQWTTFFLLFALWNCPAQWAESQIWDPGVALLGNERCLEGRIELVGDRYVVRKTEGNQVSIPREQVQFVGQSKSEVYQFKKRYLTSKSRPGDHYKLARWCLSVNMLAEAGEHYLSLAKTHPPTNNPTVKRLGVEIKDAMLQQSDFRRYLGMAPVVRPESPARSSSPEGTKESTATSIVAASGITHGYPLPYQQTPNQQNGWAQTTEYPVVTAHAVTPTLGSVTPGPEPFVPNSSLYPLRPGSQSYRTVPTQNNPDGLPTNSRDSRLGNRPHPYELSNFPVGADIPTEEELNALDEWITTELGYPPVRTTQDPFDPEEFNRLRAAAENSTSAQILWNQQP